MGIKSIPSLSKDQHWLSNDIQTSMAGLCFELLWGKDPPLNPSLMAPLR